MTIYDPSFKRLHSCLSTIMTKIHPNNLYTLVVYDNNSTSKYILWLVINIHGYEFLEESITDARTILEYKPLVTHSEYCKYNTNNTNNNNTFENDTLQYIIINNKEYSINIFLQSHELCNNMTIPIRNDFDLNDFIVQHNLELVYHSFINFIAPCNKRMYTNYDI